MEAANRGASEARGVNIGLNISLPFEQTGNAYITRGLAFEFHYFFMRKYWFAYLAKAMVAMPGGFGTLDEFIEVITLVQTLKIKKPMPMVLFGDRVLGQVLDFGPGRLRHDQPRRPGPVLPHRLGRRGLRVHHRIPRPVLRRRTWRNPLTKQIGSVTARIDCTKALVCHRPRFLAGHAAATMLA